MSLHQAQSHPILRTWQCQRNDINHHADFVLPMFIGNNDDAIEPIESMPDVNRYGCNTAVKYLEPLVYSFGLRAVLLFPVVTKAQSVSEDQVGFVGGDSNDQDDEEDDDDDDTDFTSSSSEQSLTTESNSADGSDDDSDDEPKKGRIISIKRKPSTSSRNKRIPATDKSPTPTGVFKNSKDQDVRLIRGLALREENNPVLRLIPKLREKFPNLLIICDVCLCAFTSTGHCCLFDDHSIKTKASSLVNNNANYVNIVDSHDISDKTVDQTLRVSDVNPGERKRLPNIELTQYLISNKISCQYLAKLAIEYASRGCNVLAPSDMMDGRIQVIREKLNENHLHHVSIMSYSAKFASSFYGPFRQAAASKPQFGDRKAYQLPPGSRAMALKAVSRDIDQGKMKSMLHTCIFWFRR